MTVSELLNILNALPDDLEVKGFNYEFEAYIDPTVTVEYIIENEEAYGGWSKRPSGWEGGKQVVTIS